MRTTALLLAAFVPALAPAVAQQDVPRFGARSDIVTVDVVVTDREGRPVSGLAREDFLVTEDGRAQTLASFEAVESRADVVVAPESGPVATNAIPSPPGRTFVVVFDDLHLSPAGAKKADSALSALLGGVFSAGDRVSVVPVAGGAGWSGRMPDAREDLRAVLSRLEGRRIPDVSAGRITDYEALMIHTLRDKQVGAEVQRRYYDNGLLVERFQFQGEGSPPADLGEGHPLVRARAAEVYTAAVARDGVTFRVLHRVLDGLAEVRGRKTVVLVSEGFIHDPGQPAFKRVVNASRRANAPVYFLDPRDVTGYSSYGDAEQGRSVDARQRFDTTSYFQRESREAAGSETVALDTGGDRLGGDLVRGMSRVVEESRVYYLLGYEPGNKDRDGKFRKIEVKLRRPGLEVRARKGYYASEDAPAAAATAPLDPAVRSVFDAPEDAAGVPLRLTSYVLGPTSGGKARVLVTGELDPRGLAFQEREGRSDAALESFVRVVSRDTGESLARERLVELRLPPEARAAFERTWVPLVRDFELAPGRYQARLAVREKATGRLGSVTRDFEVPAEGFRISTPILTDALQPARDAGSAQPIPIARRSFAPGTQLHYVFEVYGASAEGAASGVSAGYSVRGPDGSIMGRVAAAPVPRGPDGRLSQAYTLSLEGAPAGDYAVLLDVADGATGRKLHVEDAFAVAGSRSSSSASYLELVAQYGKGDADAAVASLLGRPRSEIEEAPRQIQASGAGCDARCVQSAALLHTSAAIRESGRGRPDLADPQLKAARRILDLRERRTPDPFEARWWLAMGYSFLAEADLGRALHDFEQALSRDPSSVQALVAVGSVHEAIGALDTAEADPGDVAPVGSPTLPLLNKIAQKERALKAAEEHYRRALAASPYEPEARLRLGRVLQLRQKPKEAQAELERVLSQGDDRDARCLAYLFLGELADGATREAEALERYRAAAKERPESQSAALAVSDALRRAGDAAEARAVVEGVLGGSRAVDPWLAYNLGKPGRAEALVAELRQGP